MSKVKREIHFKKVAIIGVGLIGGSIAIVLREKGITKSIIGIGRGVKNLEAAKKLGVVDEFTQDVKEGVKDADLVVAAIPVASIARVIREALPFFKNGAIITDVGSVKKSIVDEIESFLPPEIHFVGGHPIAGTENAGVEAASLTLFQNRKCIITPTKKTGRTALEKVKRIWEIAGSEVILMDAERHDRILAAVSHLPHVVAYALVNTVSGVRDFDEDIVKYSAGGFKDFTRIASSPPEMWRDICLLNRDAILDVIRRFRKTLEGLEQLIAGNNSEGIMREFEKAKNIKNSLKTNSK
ncbi:MAG: prephenate dehydrogenase [Deltaproteobacteria bacterium GWC2_42_11]|nr:MAG: prephenate dehydrogenase [Deltaproteobacteria bacterium GWC2_42_11]HBO83759.1 prephenate dehydrogenase/arogenate dehydrogenase family protein [Deltaproteobacteria bacterium]